MRLLLGSPMYVLSILSCGCVKLSCRRFFHATMARRRRACPADVVWLLFLMKDMVNLDLASRMLGSVERGFRKAHGPGLQRLTALKGEYCAEKLLYVRLHLLQV